MCVLSTLCGNVDKHSPFDIYIYIPLIYMDVITYPYPDVALDILAGGRGPRIESVKSCHA